MHSVLFHFLFLVLCNRQNSLKSGHEGGWTSKYPDVWFSLDKHQKFWCRMFLWAFKMFLLLYSQYLPQQVLCDMNTSSFPHNYSQYRFLTTHTQEACQSLPPALHPCNRLSMYFWVFLSLISSSVQSCSWEICFQLGECHFCIPII